MAGESMDINDTDTNDQAVAPAPDGGDAGEFADVAAKADNPDSVRRALQAEREAAKRARREAEALAAKVKEFEDRDKSETEKLLEERNSLKERSVTVEQENLRLRISIEKSLPLELVDRLRGNTREEMEADADQLLSLVTKTTNGSRGDVDQGARGGSGIAQLSRDDIKSMNPAEIVAAKKEGRLDALLGVST